ncbi:enoyl-CoA hydratase [Novosphingobium marinum]|uniref:Enoyl-CoA hydratase/carnithine racemase n=1 Tax=Novosphingobium marinum TaxID=1514948 RepID=A0A7Z0BSI6_9SPHN|nr:crotonase/enoyl-CoA hydratase family protein [Novosphingobium marinum]NYH94956.1 enoyl-CoA hydratase/carnithine racemase [Novosphingobium marinum]GGC41301.1 enoyl-CoA hydratase [Novosphingobium marinum]
MAILRIEKRGHVAILTLDRPDTLNALGAEGDGAEFAAACEALNDDIEVRCAILTGAGRAFSAGGNVKAMRDRTEGFGGSAVDLRNFYRTNVHRIARAIHGLDVPLIAAVNGPAIGLGCDVACLCDMRIASDEARFGVTFLKIGLVPGDGGTWILPRIVGPSRAAELLYTGDIIDARTACEWGLVSRVVGQDALLDSAFELAERIARMPPHALRLTKRMMRQGQTLGYDAALDLAASTQPLMHLGDDHMEGINALLERREPRFTGD